MASVNENTKDGIEIEIDLVKLWKVAKKVWIPIVLVAIILTGVVAVVYRKMYTPIYSSSSQYYVSNISVETALYSSSQTTAAENMAKYYMDFVKGNSFLEYVVNDLKMEDVTIGRLKGMISTSHTQDSALFTVTVSGPDAELNDKVCKSIEKTLPVFCDYMNNQMVDAAGNIIVNPQLDFSVASKTMKVNEYSVQDKTPDNRGTLVKYPFVAFFISVVIGFMIAFAFSFFDVNIYTEEDLRNRLTDHPIFGVIPRVEAKGSHKKRKKFSPLFPKKIPEREIIPLLDENSSFLLTESFHQLRTNVTFCSEGKKGCAIGVASSTAAFGKTLLMSNLSISLSHMIDKKVLLVDGDLRCPAVHEFFKIKNEVGLSNLLAGQATIEETLHHYSDSLDIVTSGSIPPNPIELLSCKKMEELMEQWKSQYDYILLDLPPVGQVADAFSVAPLLSGFLFAMRSRYANARFEKRVVNMMTEKGTKILGYVLTDVEREHHAKDYKYGSYYRGSYHREYYSHYVKSKQPKTDDQQPCVQNTK